MLKNCILWSNHGICAITIGSFHTFWHSVWSSHLIKHCRHSFLALFYSPLGRVEIITILKIMSQNINWEKNLVFVYLTKKRFLTPEKPKSNSKTFLLSCFKCYKKVILNVWQACHDLFKFKVYLCCSGTITHLKPIL